MELDGKRFWVTDPEHGFKLGKLVDIGSDSLTIEPFDIPGKVRLIILYFLQMNVLRFKGE